jgi:hypothetical protein
MKGALALTLILLATTVFLSGCTMPGSETNTAPTSSAGLTVNYVRTSMNYVKSGDSITITAQAQNTGDRNINLVTAVPFMLPWPGFSVTYPCYNLERPNAEIERLGGVCPASWPNVQVPRVTKQETYPVGVRFYYDYSTVTQAKVFAVSGNSYMGYKERAESLPMTKIVDWGTGPISVDASIDSVIIIPSMGAAARRVPVTLKFNNVGGGYPQTYGSSARNYQINSVAIDTSTTGGMYITDLGSCSGTIPMRGGASGECIFWLMVPSNAMNEVVMDLKITSSYGYYIEDKSQIITVNPDIEDTFN